MDTFMETFTPDQIERQRALWEQIEQHLKTAKGIAWDGCHKTYVLMDEGQMEEMRGYGYAEGESVLISSALASPGEMGTYLRNWFEQSCPLRFISAVRTVDGDPNEGFTGLIEQCEDAYSEQEVSSEDEE